MYRLNHQIRINGAAITPGPAPASDPDMPPPGPKPAPDGRDGVRPEAPGPAFRDPFTPITAPGRAPLITAPGGDGIAYHKEKQQ